MKNYLVAILLIGLIYSLGCNTPKNASVNPNGDSELAVLMRDMFDDGMDMKERISKGKLPKSHIDVGGLFTAEPTDSAQIAGPEYAAYAKAYEMAYNNLMTSEGDDIVPAYNSLVSTCISCHEATCPGPIVRIKKMEIEP